MPALKFVGQRGVVDAQAMQIVAWRSWMCTGSCDDVVAVIVGFASDMPGLMPPPAIHM